MCDECHQSPHATMCPNGTPMVDEYLVDCALCGAEVDEDTTNYGICEKCWTDNQNLHNARAYGAKATESVKINGLYAKVLTPEQIEFALYKEVQGIEIYDWNKLNSLVHEFLRDDDGDFAGWLKEQKGNE